MPRPDPTLPPLTPELERLLREHAQPITPEMEQAVRDWRPQSLYPVLPEVEAP